MGWFGIENKCLWVLSPSRMIAKSKNNGGGIRSYRKIMGWNFGFQIVTFEIFCISIADRLTGLHIPPFLYIIAGLYALGRINELLFAFFEDALDRLEGKEPRIELSKSERIKLLAFGYVETIV